MDNQHIMDIFYIIWIISCRLEYSFKSDRVSCCVSTSDVPSRCPIANDASAAAASAAAIFLVSRIFAIEMWVRAPAVSRSAGSRSFIGIRYVRNRAVSFCWNISFCLVLFIDINKGIIDINNSFIDINKYG